MKNSLLSQLMLGFSLVALPFLGGCSQQNADSPNPFVGTANAEPTSSETNLALVIPAPPNFPVAEAGGAVSAPMETNAATQTEMAMPPTAPVTEVVPPADVRLSPALTEVVKLVQSGVEQAVLLTFITNTTGYFAMGAEEIVYLNDLGVAGNVMTAMMQHDQGLRVAGTSAAQEQMKSPAQVAEPEIASAPSYIEPPAVEAQPVQVSNTYFNDTLAPYGSWVFVSGFGRCWRPTVVIGNPSWRPYCDRGRWVFSNCGWFWLSDYSWGATTFHFGRWFNDPRWGWCWWPNTVWAPSWVSWRFTSGFCGWAPLPPTSCFRPGFGLMFQNGPVGMNCGFGLGANVFVFVPWGNFCGPRPSQHCLPSSRANQVFHASTPVNHLEAGGRGEVNNRGIDPDLVRQHTRAEIRTVNIRDQAGHGLRAEALQRDGRTLAVHRPQFAFTDDGNSNMSELSGRGAGRNGAPGGNETAISKTPMPPSPLSSTRAGRVEAATERNRTGMSRRVEPVTALPTPTTPSMVGTKLPTRVETRPVQEHEQLAETQTVIRTRPSAPVVVRTPEVATPKPAPVAPTRKVEQPRVIQVTPQTAQRPASPSSSLIVIGGGNNNVRSSGRDYSVWSTPSSTPGAPLASTRGGASTRSTPTPNVNSPQIVENSPAPVARAQSEFSRSSRSEFGRPENRNSYPTYSTAPRPGQVITPAPSFTPRPMPSAAPSAPRVESRPAPSAPATVPSTSRPTPGQGWPNR